MNQLQLSADYVLRRSVRIDMLNGFNARVIIQTENIELKIRFSPKILLFLDEKPTHIVMYGSEI